MDYGLGMEVLHPIALQVCVYFTTSSIQTSLSGQKMALEFIIINKINQAQKDRQSVFYVIYGTHIIHNTYTPRFVSYLFSPFRILFMSFFLTLVSMALHIGRGRGKEKQPKRRRERDVGKIELIIFYKLDTSHSYLGRGNLNFKIPLSD